MRRNHTHIDGDQMSSGVCPSTADAPSRAPQLKVRPSASCGKCVTRFINGYTACMPPSQRQCEHVTPGPQRVGVATRAARSALANKGAYVHRRLHAWDQGFRGFGV